MSDEGTYSTITLTPEQLEASKADIGAFVRLRDFEMDRLLQDVYKRLYPFPEFIGPIQRPPFSVRFRRKLRALKWRVRALLGRPIHALAEFINPGGCADEHECC